MKTSLLRSMDAVLYMQFAVSYTVSPVFPQDSYAMQCIIPH